MSAALKKRPRASSQPDDSGVFRRPRDVTRMGVVEQVREALKPRSRMAAVFGALLGGFVPLSTYVLAHGALPWGVYPLVLGGLLFSARTVFQWAQLAFGEPLKALGFVVLVEGTMTVSSTPGWLALTALAYLIAINGIATGCRLAMHQRGNR